MGSPNGPVARPDAEHCVHRSQSAADGAINCGALDAEVREGLAQLRAGAASRPTRSRTITYPNNGDNSTDKSS
eukprot:6424479-Pyramimonas_sp.AAC.1